MWWDDQAVEGQKGCSQKRSISFPQCPQENAACKLTRKIWKYVRKGMVFRIIKMANSTIWIMFNTKKTTLPEYHIMNGIFNFLIQNHTAQFSGIILPVCGRFTKYGITAPYTVVHFSWFHDVMPVDWFVAEIHRPTRWTNPNPWYRQGQRNRHLVTFLQTNDLEIFACGENKIMFVLFFKYCTALYLIWRKNDCCCTAFSMQQHENWLITFDFIFGSYTKHNTQVQLVLYLRVSVLDFPV